MQWDFGDGGTATGCCPNHRYGADGIYTVTVTVSTFDGRTATTGSVSVETHDVSIERILAPNTARAARPRASGSACEVVSIPRPSRVELYRSRAGGSDELVATETLAVPVARGGRTAAASFTYNFTSDDASVGKVTFRAVAILVDARDALPADNQAIAPPAEVRG